MRLSTKTLSLLALSTGLLFTSCGGNAEKQKQMAMMAAMQQGGGYELLTLAPESRTLEVSYPASIRGRQDVDIYPQISGSLIKILVNEGDVVRAGQVLFVLNQVPYQAAVTQADASVQVARTALSNAQMTYDAKKRLYDEKVISDFELQTAQNALQSAQASLQQAQAAATNARNSLSYTTVTAPCSGVIGTLPYRQGALVGPTMAQALTTISDNSEMYVYFSMDENSVLALTRRWGSPEAAVKNMPPVTLTLSDGTQYGHEGKVESISGVLDRQTGSTTLRAKFPNPEKLLHSGSSGNVLIPATYSDVFVVPTSATVQVQDKISVFKVIDGKAVSTVIEVQPINNGTEYVVSSGLSAGDVIVASGAGLLREGAQVQAVTSQDKAAAPQAQGK